MRWTSSFTMAAALLTLGLIAPATARTQYHKAFKTMYEKSRPKLVEMKCAVCHGATGTNKKVRNDYGKAFGKALGATNVKDEAKINAALKEVEGQLPSDDK
ncbi:MAG TPA: hypothetical protein VM510_13020 [Caulifigura sp.]|jgi:mono/diheme cytochrome c family protein|nr:hypothetical protein [Caulifigura sp.]